MRVSAFPRNFIEPLHEDPEWRYADIPARQDFYNHRLKVARELWAYETGTAQGGGMAESGVYVQRVNPETGAPVAIPATPPNPIPVGNPAIMPFGRNYLGFDMAFEPRTSGTGERENWFWANGKRLDEAEKRNMQAIFFGEKSGASAQLYDSLYAYMEPWDMQHPRLPALFTATPGLLYNRDQYNNPLLLPGLFAASAGELLSEWAAWMPGQGDPLPASGDAARRYETRYHWTYTDLGGLLPLWLPKITGGDQDRLADLLSLWTEISVTPSGVWPVPMPPRLPSANSTELGLKNQAGTDLDDYLRVNNSTPGSSAKTLALGSNPQRFIHGLIGLAIGDSEDVPAVASWDELWLLAQAPSPALTDDQIKQRVKQLDYLRKWGVLAEWCPPGLALPYIADTAPAYNLRDIGSVNGGVPSDLRLIQAPFATGSGPGLDTLFLLNANTATPRTLAALHAHYQHEIYDLDGYEEARQRAASPYVDRDIAFEAFPLYSLIRDDGYLYDNMQEPLVDGAGNPVNDADGNQIIQEYREIQQEDGNPVRSDSMGLRGALYGTLVDRDVLNTNFDQVNYGGGTLDLLTVVDDFTFAIFEDIYKMDPSQTSFNKAFSTAKIHDKAARWAGGIYSGDLASPAGKAFKTDRLALRHEALPAVRGNTDFSLGSGHYPSAVHSAGVYLLPDATTSWIAENKGDPPPPSTRNAGWADLIADMEPERAGQSTHATVRPKLKLTIVSDVYEVFVQSGASFEHPGPLELKYPSSDYDFRRVDVLASVLNLEGIGLCPDYDPPGGGAHPLGVCPYCDDYRAYLPTIPVEEEDEKNPETITGSGQTNSGKVLYAMDMYVDPNKQPTSLTDWDWTDGQAGGANYAYAPAPPAGEILWGIRHPTRYAPSDNGTSANPVPAYIPFAAPATQENPARSWFLDVEVELRLNIHLLNAANVDALLVALGGVPVSGGDVWFEFDNNNAAILATEPSLGYYDYMGEFSITEAGPGPDGHDWLTANGVKYFKETAARMANDLLAHFLDLDYKLYTDLAKRYPPIARLYVNQPVGVRRIVARGEVVDTWNDDRVMAYTDHEYVDRPQTSVPADGLEAGKSIDSATDPDYAPQNIRLKQPAIIRQRILKP